MDLSKFTTPKINYLRENLNLTEDEEIVFDMLSKHKSRIQIADKLQLSVSCIDKRIKQLRTKIKELENENCKISK